MGNGIILDTSSSLILFIYIKIQLTPNDKIHMCFYIWVNFKILTFFAQLVDKTGYIKLIMQRNFDLLTSYIYETTKWTSEEKLCLNKYFNLIHYSMAPFTAPLFKSLYEVLYFLRFKPIERTFRSNFAYTKVKQGHFSN